MLKKLLVIDGVIAVCRFQDDGSVSEAVGMLPEALMHRLAQFAHWYQRMVSGNTDLFSLFSQMRGWSPAQGWIVKGGAMSVCCVGNLVCLMQNEGASLNEVQAAIREAAHE
jgi:roadblock/LC7 domain-containing protein